jgi:hypothetical protein
LSISRGSILLASATWPREVGLEKGRVELAGKPIPIEHRATTVCHRRAGTWKIVHPRTDLSPTMLDLL